MSLKNLRVSKAIKHHRYDAKTQKLTIEFRSGRTYSYAGVPPAEYEAFDKAESLGRHFGSRIRGKYAHELVSERRA